MKRLVIMISILVLAFTACSTDNGNDNGGNFTTLTINGLPPHESPPPDSSGYAVYILPTGTDFSTLQEAIQAWETAGQIWEAIGTANSGNVFTLSGYTDKYHYYEYWTKSGNFWVQLLRFSPQQKQWYATVSFSNGNGTTQFSSFIEY